MSCRVEARRKSGPSCLVLIAPHQTALFYFGRTRMDTPPRRQPLLRRGVLPLADGASFERWWLCDLVGLASAAAVDEWSGAGGRCGGGPRGRVEGGVDRGLGDIGEAQVVVAGVPP